MEAGKFLNRTRRNVILTLKPGELVDKGQEFTMAQHGLKPIVYLKVNNCVSRGKIIVFTDQTPRRLQLHTHVQCATMHPEDKLDSSIIDEFTTKYGLLQSSPLIDNQEEEGNFR